LLHLTIAYHAARSGAGQLTTEVLDPEDNVLGRAERHVEDSPGTMDAGKTKSSWRSRCRWTIWCGIASGTVSNMTMAKTAGLEGAESISQILRTPVVHILATAVLHDGRRGRRCA
jgi:hypothetical protein